MPRVYCRQLEELGFKEPSGFRLSSLKLGHSNECCEREAIMNNRMKTYLVRAMMLQWIWLCGCSSVALRHDYANYSDVYGDSSNEQLLLNLARESKQEPVYFVQLASISSQYQFSTSAGFTPSTTRTAPPSVTGASASMIPGLVQHTLTFGGSLNAGISQTPVFQFLPLTGSNFVQTLLSPISDKVFWTFYDQGWPGDWVARTILNSVQEQIDELKTNEDGSVVTNSYIETYVNDTGDPTYPKFLEYCNDLYIAQRYHILEVDRAVTAPSKAVYRSTNAPLKEIISAIAAGLTVNYDTNSYTIVKRDDNLKFLVKSNEDSQIRHFYAQYVDNSIGASRLAETKHLKITNGVASANTNQPADTNYTIDNDLFLKKEAATNAMVFAKKFSDKKIALTTRTFEEALNAVANEEADFKSFEQSTNLLYANNITFKSDPCGTIAKITPANGPAFTVRPILMIKYDDSARPLLAPFVTITHNRVEYTIGDLREDREDPERAYLDESYPSRANDAHYQNSTVFTMISYLFSQATIDTSKLPVQQLIQVQ